MALTDENMVLPVAPMGGNGNGNCFGNSDLGWFVLIILLANGGMWGGFGGGFNNMALGYDFPWLLNGQNNINANTNEGFQNAMLNDGITSIRDGISSLSTQLCGCCGDMQMAVANGFAGVEQNANTRQVANMQQDFAMQTAMMQGFNGVQGQLAQASSDNRLGVANLGADIAREACATRTSDTQNTQVILNAINDGFRAMSDQRYQDKIDAKNDEIAQLRQENLYARGQASQVAQDSRIINGVYNRLSECPVGTVPVYGEQPIFTCNNNGCGCGNNGFLN